MSFPLPLRRAGVTFDEFPSVGEHFESAPRVWVYFWIAASGCALVDVLIAAPYFVRLWKTAACRREGDNTIFLPSVAGFYAKIVAAAPLMGIFSLFCLSALRYSLLFELLLVLYEYASFLWLWTLVMELMGGPERFVQVAQMAPSYKTLCVLPFYIPCAFKSKKFCPCDLRISYGSVAQYGVASLLSVLCVAVSQDTVDVLRYSTVISLFVCIYGVMVVYTASRQQLRSFSIGSKFLAMKITFMLLKVINLLTRLPIASKRGGGGATYERELMQIGWRYCAVAGMSVPATIAFVLLFPAREVSQEFWESQDGNGAAKVPMSSGITQAIPSEFCDSADIAASTAVDEE